MKSPYSGVSLVKSNPFRKNSTSTRFTPLYGLLTERGLDFITRKGFDFNQIYTAVRTLTDFRWESLGVNFHFFVILEVFHVFLHNFTIDSQGRHENLMKKGQNLDILGLDCQVRLSKK